jgi:short subunit dehydrogenase-like uncharacterized protein
MAGRVVLFGATGFTGELTARALVARGARPLLVGRSADRLAALAAQLGGGDLETAVVDATAPGAADSLAALAGPGDVLICTVGPFLRWGETGVLAALRSGAHYIDSTGEPPFIRTIFERHDAAAREAGLGLLTALGYDYVPGNLAGALALREAGTRAVAVDVGYFISGGGGVQASGGTRASATGMLTEPGYAFRGGRLVSERAARHVRDIDGRPAISIGATEQFALPRVHPGLRDVGVWLGWFGPAARPLQALSAGTALATRVPGVRGALDSVTRRLVHGSTGGPGESARAKARSRIVAIASDAGGRPLATVRLKGVNPYDFTGEILAWAALRAAGGELRGVGALGPVDGFGLDELEAGVAEAGIARVDD